MHVINLDPNVVTVGWLVSRLPPTVEPTIDGLSGSFFVKTTWRLVPEGVAVPWPAGPLPLSGDVAFDGDLSQGLAYASDMVPHKPRAEFAVVGTAHPPSHGATMFEVTARIGVLWKSLVVFGARPWEPHFFSRHLSPGSARPADPTPLRYAATWGGPENGANPIGRDAHTPGAPVIELGPLMPGHTSRRHDAPAGFAPLPPMWPVRQAKTGTYGDDWTARRWPWLPHDFDLSFYNATPPDQWFERPPAGDEECRFTNLHPTIPEYRTSLPAVRPRMVLSQAIGSGLDVREVPLAIDTVWVDMDHEQLVLVWRGRAPVASLKLKEAKHLLVQMEPLSAPPRSLADFVALLAAKTAPRPPRTPPPGTPSPRKRIHDLTHRLAGAGAEARAGLVATEAKVRQARKEALDKLPAEARAAATDPATEISARDRVAALEAAAGTLASTPGVTAEQQADVAAAIERVRRRPPAAPKPARKIRGGAKAFDPRAARAKGAVNAILRGRDLSGLDLSGIDFSGANLCDANLAGASLAGARLARAALTGAILSETDLRDAILDGADLRRCTLEGAVLTGASLDRASLAGLDLAGMDLAGVHGRSADFTGANLQHARLVGARFPRGIFRKANLQSADLTGAVLAAAALDGAHAWGVHLSGANLTNLRAGEGADFSGAVLEDVRGEGSAWKAARLDGAVFDRSLLRRAVFTDALLRGARFDRADLREAVFEDANLEGAMLTRANLMHAGFAGATLEHARLDGSNLFEAAFRETVLAGATWNDANITRTRLAST